MFGLFSYIGLFGREILVAIQKVLYTGPFLNSNFSLLYFHVFFRISIILIKKIGQNFEKIKVKNF